MALMKTGLLGLVLFFIAQQGFVVTVGQATASDVRILEPAEIQWQSVLGYPPGYERTMLEGDADKSGPITYRVRLPNGFQFPPHTHPWTGHVTVLQGTWHLGIGKTFDISKTRRLKAGSFVIVPPGVPHFVVAEGQTILQLHGLGPLGMKFVEDESLANSAVKSKNGER